MRVKWGNEFSAMRKTAYALSESDVHAYVLARGMGFCEWCGAPLVTDVHRIDGGQTPESYIALCQEHGIANNLLAEKARWLERNLADEKLLYVTAAIIKDDDDRVLVCEKSNGLWEFPGGKMDEGEYLEDCLIREIREELALDISIHEPFLLVDHDYGAIKIRLFSFVVPLKEKKGIILSSHKRCDLRAVHELNDIAFSQADIAIADKLRCLKKA